MAAIKAVTMVVMEMKSVVSPNINLACNEYIKSFCAYLDVRMDSSNTIDAAEAKS